MPKRFFKSQYKRGNMRRVRPKSKRAHVYDYEQSSLVKKKVFLTLFALIIIYIFYLLFISDNFNIKQIKINSVTEISHDEIKEIVFESISGRYLGLIPKKNYFFIDYENIDKMFLEKNILVELNVSKKFPKTLNLEVKEKIGQMIWISNEQLFMVNLNGLVENQLPIRDLVNIKMPVVYDNSNSIFEPGITTMNQDLVNLILELYNEFKSYELPVIELDYFKIDSPLANYVKIVTAQGFEIHINYLSGVAKQLNKLKQSLSAGKINLNNINYINLRVENQVIYK